MSHFEQEVDYNLSESGVHPVLLNELLSYKPEMLDQLLGTELNYPYVNGDPELRNNIARLYKGATAENVLVTVGAIEANYLSIRTILNKGDEIVVMLPNYMQIWGVARNHEYDLKTFSLREENGWAPDLDELESIVSEKTKLIEDQKKAALAYNDFLLAAYMPNKKLNDFNKKDSIWKIYLTVGKGGLITPLEIRKIKKVDAVTTHFFPYITPWKSVYLVRFSAISPAAGKAVIDGDAENIKLIITSVLGSAEMVWE